MEDLGLRIKRTEDLLASGVLHAEREMLAAQAELEKLQGALREAESAWMETSAQEEKLTAALAGERVALEAEEREAATRQAAVKRELAAAEERLAAIDHSRREAAQTIPAAIRDRYRALYARTGGRPFALAVAGECSHCHHSVPAAAVQMLRAHTGVPSCPSCGRLLLPG